MSWFRDENETDKRFMLELEQLKLRDVDSGYMSRSHYFTLFNVSGKNLYNTFKTLDLSCESQDDLDSWKASFLRAGVYPEKDTEIEGGDNEDARTDNVAAGSLDPQLERQVETIRNLVDSYMKIVTKTCKDMVPKMIMFLMINNTKEFINGELLASLYSGDPQVLMEESSEEAGRREEMMKLYEACKEALKIIGDISSSTANTMPTNHGRTDWSGLSSTLSTKPSTTSRSAPSVPGRSAPSVPARPAPRR